MAFVILNIIVNPGYAGVVVVLVDKTWGPPGLRLGLALTAVFLFAFAFIFSPAACTCPPDFDWYACPTALETSAAFSNSTVLWIYVHLIQFNCPIDLPVSYFAGCWFCICLSVLLSILCLSSSCFRFGFQLLWFVSDALSFFFLL